MTRAHTTIVIGVALAAMLAGCGGEPERTRTSAPAPPANANVAPAPAPVETRPVALEREALARTAKLFDATCATCHMRNGKGDPHHRTDNIPDFTDRAWQAAEKDEDLRDTITKGTGKVMPAFGAKLSTEQIDELVAYVRGFPDRPAPPADTTGPMRHDDAATKPGSRKAAAPAPAKKPAKPAPAKKPDHSGHGDHPHH